MNKFTASNGVVIENRGGSLFIGSTILFGAGSTHGPALREFFRAEEDERLGRWRWPEKPNYIVIADGSYDVEVFDEEALDEARLYARDSVSFSGDFGGAARAYFDAHPEPKPWHEAKVGEVWEFTIDSGWTHAAYLKDDGKWRWTQGGFVGMDGVESARRIWPEAS